MSIIHVAVLASGAGTNAKNLIHHFRDHAFIRVALIICNNPRAGVLTIAAEENIPVEMIGRDHFSTVDRLLSFLEEKKIDFLVLAGFLWLLPGTLVAHYHKRILNIHPALLPRHGGKGMFGNRVHELVIDNGDAETGITIHFVDEQYDQGQIIFQAKCRVAAGDTPSVLSEKVHGLEYRHFPKVVEMVINLQNIVKSEEPATALIL